MQRPYNHTLQGSPRSKSNLKQWMDEEENAEIVMTTLNGLPRSWDSFIQGICGRKKLVNFSRLWKNAHKKKLEKKIWEVKIKLSQLTPRKEEEALITLEVRTSTRKITM